ncbi:MAG: HD-GYP domain-containing protein [Schwartzia sp.]|nr:HD-GYP domain-containing protein [Schwartzia sp. (in: firmicutes)]
MINLPIQKLRPGMVTAQSIYNRQGVSYLTRGTAVTEKYISRLKKIGVKNLTVTSMNPNYSILPPDDIIQEKTRVDAINKLYDTYHALEEKGELNTNLLEGVSENILLDILSNRSNLVQLTDLRMHDDYTFAHSVNVAVLSAMLGALCNLPRESMLDLIMGSLLHDIGKISIPTEILTKPGRLSQSEFSIMQMHPDAGRAKIRELTSPSATIYSLIAEQHHEHMDGRGYPGHIKGERIHKLARIVAIADVYDALTSCRSYKPAYKPHIAHNIMMKCSPGQFDESLLKLFFDNVAIYPVGTVIETTMGYAIVKKSEFGRTRTPLICVFGDMNGNVLPHPFDIDLNDCPPDTVTGVLEDMKLIPLLLRMKIDPAKFLQDEEKI